MTQVFNIAVFGACAQVWWRFFFYSHLAIQLMCTVFCLTLCLSVSGFFIILLILCWLWPVAMWICCWHCQKYAYLTYKPLFGRLCVVNAFYLFIWVLANCENHLIEARTFLSTHSVRRMWKNSTHRERLKETKREEERDGWKTTGRSLCIYYDAVKHWNIPWIFVSKSPVHSR